MNSYLVPLKLTRDRFSSLDDAIDARGDVLAEQNIKLDGSTPHGHPRRHFITAKETELLFHLGFRFRETPTDSQHSRGQDSFDEDRAKEVLQVGGETEGNDIACSESWYLAGDAWMKIIS